MTTSPAETKAALLESAVARVRERLEGNEADDVERFVRAYYANASPDDLVGRNDLDLYGAAMAHWQLARLRRPGELKVHVYNPNVEEHGWESPHTVVEMVNDDMPFLVDSVTMEVNRHGIAMHLVVRPIMRRPPRRGGSPARGRQSRTGSPESLIHVEIDRSTDLDALEQLRADLERVLGDVRAAVEDWQAMRAAGARGDRRARAVAAAGRGARSWRRRAACCSGCTTTTSPSSATASTSSAPRTARTCCALVPGTGPRHPPRTDERPHLAQLRQAAAGGAAARTREDAADPHQGELAVDRAPARLPRLRRREALRRRRRGRGGAPLPRPLHPHGLQREPVGDPAAAAEGRSACSSAPACCPGATTTRR